MSVPRWRPALKMLRTKMSRHAAENLNTQKRKTQKAKRINFYDNAENCEPYIFCEVVGKNVPATIPKGNMGYAQYTVPDTVAVETTFVAFL